MSHLAKSVHYHKDGIESPLGSRKTNEKIHTISSQGAQAIRKGV